MSLIHERSTDIQPGNSYQHQPHNGTDSRERERESVREKKSCYKVPLHQLIRFTSIQRREPGTLGATAPTTMANCINTWRMAINDGVSFPADPSSSEQCLTSHSTHNWSFQRRVFCSQSVALGLTINCNSQNAHRSTQPCIPPGSLNRVPASAGVRAGMSPLPGCR